MAFEGLRDQLKEQWADLSAKVQENPTFNNLREKFESQTPEIQKAIVAAAGVLMALFLLSFPYGYWSTSSEYLTQFEENRELIQGLLNASRSVKTPSPLPEPLSADMLKGRVEAILRNNRLLPDQIGDSQVIPQPPVAQGIPASVIQNGLAVQIKKLNLTQVVQIGNQLQNLGGGIKLMGLDVLQSPGQTHYYDMIVKIVHFGLPQIADSGPDTPDTTRKRPGTARKQDEEAE